MSDDRGVANQPPASEASPTAAPRPQPPGVHLPQPTVWPAVLASGMTLLAWGVITNYAVSAAGAILFAIAAWGWVQELRRETRARRREQRDEVRRP